MFKKSSAPERGEQDRRIDDILADLPRGHEGRNHRETRQAQGYFETPEVLGKIGFEDHSGDNFLGIIGGTTERIVRADGRIEYKSTGGIPVGSRDDRHETLVAGSRSGKGRSVLIPRLLTSAGSFIVNDCKGELAAITARYRAESLGQKVCILDPFRITPPQCEVYRKQFNPMSLVRMENPTVIEDAALISDALVVPQGSKDSHWDETAKAFIEAIILLVACGNFRPEERTLLTVAELIAGKRGSIKWLLDEMEQTEGPDNRIGAAAITLREMGENERGSVLSNARKNLKFLDLDSMQSVLGYHDFDLEDLKNGAMTIYLVLPATRMSACKQWLRLFVNLTLAAMEKNRTKPKYPVQMLLDEMPVLGYMKELESAIGQMAGLDLKITSVIQDFGQLKAIYKDRFETFLGNSGVLQFFGNVDYFSSEWIGKYLGKTTLRIYEQGAKSLDSSNNGNSGTNFKQQVHDLMTPEEVRRYFARDDYFNRQLVCIPGKRPYILQRANYDQHELFRGRFDERE